MLDARSAAAWLRWAALPLAFCVAAMPASAQQRFDIAGLWKTHDPGASVRIARCGRGYCGTLASVGEGTVDVNNPNPALRNRRLVGLTVFSAGTPIPNGQRGQLYNPRDGRTYSGSLTAIGPDTLTVSGCVLGMFCRSQTWARIR